jgi:3-methyl-2-oxobutanoate hydroxymethyltransferase
MVKRINVNYFKQKKKANEKIVALTAYDAPTAKFAEEAGIELILVGDSLGMAVLGYDTTIPVTIEESIHHCCAVRRGAHGAFIVGDMPFMTYRLSIESTLKNAARYMQEAMVDAVKVEGGKEIADTIKMLVTAGVPVLGHIGLLPQSVKTAGGYKITGRTDLQAENLLEDALAVQDAGAFAVVLEGVTKDVAKHITEKLEIPTIGIGAGVFCDGQIQVVNDLLGLFTDFVPKHAKQYVNLGERIKEAFESYHSDVTSSTFPTDKNSF